MTNYKVNESMERAAYPRLKDAGWVTGGTHQGEEWSSADGKVEIRFLHTMNVCNVGYREKLHRGADESGEAFLDRKATAGWHSKVFAHQFSQRAFEVWLDQALSSIEVWAKSMESVHRAPGE